MYTNAKAKGHFCQAKKRDKVCKQNTGSLPKVAEALWSPLELRLHAVPLISSWAVELRSFQHLVFLPLQEARDCLFENLALPDSIIIFIPSGVSGVTGDTGYRVSDITVSLFLHLYISSSSYIYMKYWACFTVCLLVPSKRQKANVRQQKDKNV